MGRAGSNSERRLAVLCSRRRIRRAWIVSIISSESVLFSRGQEAPQGRSGKRKKFAPGLTIWNDRTMQTCFREHPEIYGSELEEEEEEEEEEEDENETGTPPEDGAQSPSPAPLPEPADGSLPAAATSASPETQAPPPSPPPSSSSSAPPASEPGTSDTERARAAKRQVESEHGGPTSESDGMVPKAAHDATGANAVERGS